MPKPLTIDQRLCAASEDVMAALLDLSLSGHPVAVDLDNRRLSFDNGFTQVEDVLRFRKTFPALKRFSFRLPVDGEDIPVAPDPLPLLMFLNNFQKLAGSDTLASSPNHDD